MIASITDWLNVASAALAGVLAPGAWAYSPSDSSMRTSWATGSRRLWLDTPPKFETTEQRKRVVSERLDRERSETINKIMEQRTAILERVDARLIIEPGPRPSRTHRAGTCAD